MLRIYARIELPGDQGQPATLVIIWPSLGGASVGILTPETNGQKRAPIDFAGFGDDPGTMTRVPVWSEGRRDMRGLKCVGTAFKIP